MFKDMGNLASVDATGLDVSAVTSMNAMFRGCEALTTLTGLSDWNVSRVTDMSWMFESCIALPSFDIAKWDVSSVKNMDVMFRSCMVIETLDLSDWVTSSLEETSNMFMNCQALRTIWVGTGWIMEKVEFMYNGHMFQDCPNLKGGAGTTYDASHDGPEYAHVDGGSANPGYLSGTVTGTIGTAPYKLVGDTLIVGAGEFVINDWNDVVDALGREGIKSVTFTGSAKITGDALEMFDDFTSLESLDASGLDVSGVTSMQGMFNQCEKLVSLDGLSGWDVSNVTDMRFLFRGCKSLTSLAPLAGWDTSSVTDMNSLFCECKALASADGIADWDTSSVTDMQLLFQYCESLSSVEALSGWDTSKVADMNHMFHGCKALVSLDALTGWDVSMVGNMERAFDGCTSLTDADGISGWDTAKVTSMGGMFSGCSSLASLDLPGWNTSSVTNMSYMFEGCAALQSIWVDGGWSTSAVTSSTDMFKGCSSLVGGRGTAYSEWHTDKAYARVDAGSTKPGYLSGTVTGTIGTAPYVFAFDTLTVGAGEFVLDNWNTEIARIGRANVKSVVFTGGAKMTGSARWMFDEFTSLESLDASGLDVSGVTSMERMFYQCEKLVSLDGLSGWDVSGVTSMSWMFYQCEKLVSLDGLSGWDVSGVTSMERMFYHCEKLVSLDGLSDWDVSSVTEMALMFSGCGSLASLDGLSDWNVSGVTGMVCLFNSCKALVSVDGVGGWDTSSVTTMEGLFWDCESLSSTEALSGWDTSKVDSMYHMFSGCTSLASLDLTGWDTSSVTRMAYMFSDCTSLATVWVGDGWSTRAVPDSVYMFRGCTSLVGGAGTAFSAGHTDAAYARADGGADAPGYLTLGWAVAVGSARHCDVEPSAARAATGAAVAVRVTPHDGYEVASVSVEGPGGPVEVAGEGGEFAFAMPAGDVTVSVETRSLAPSFESAALVLNGTVNVRFYADLSSLGPEQREGSSMSFTVGGRARPDAAFDASVTSSGGEGWYGFTCPASSIQMSDEIVATLRWDGGEVSTAYSVEEYARRALARGETDETTRGLVRALLDYGHHAQLFLSGANGWSLGTDYARTPAACDVDEGAEAVDGALVDACAEAIEAEPATSFAKDLPEGCGVSGLTMSLVLESSTDAVVKFDSPGDEPPVVALEGGAQLEAERSGGKWRVAVPGIRAQGLAEPMTVTVDAGGSGRASLTFSALSYARALLASDAYADDADARAAMACLWRYNRAVLAFRAAHGQ